MRVLAAASLALLAAATAGCSAAAQPAAGPHASPAAARTTAPAGPALVGQAVVIRGERPGEQLTVTLVKVIPGAKPYQGLMNSPGPGMVLYAAQFRVVNTGTRAYNGTPDTGTILTGTSGQSWDAGLDQANGCQPFATGAVIPAGGKGLGCVTFGIPRHASVASVSWNDDSSFGPQTGTWKA